MLVKIYSFIRKLIFTQYLCDSTYVIEAYKSEWNRKREILFIFIRNSGL